jgi:hypothetical protein
MFQDVLLPLPLFAEVRLGSLLDVEIGPEEVCGVCW